jgi:formamidopyrimidine-DNA glycosylase
VKLTQKLSPEETRQLFESTRDTLTKWIELLRADATRTASPRKRVTTSTKVQKTISTVSEDSTLFPEKVTAFRPEMAVHGKYGQPCPRCGQKIQRIRYASNETNYCPECQTGGKLLADRALSRLLGKDWPRSLEELEGLTSR